MKKSATLAAVLIAGAFAVCGCAGAQTEQPSNGMTVGGALQKSVEIRQQVQDAKNTAGTAQTVNNAAGGSVKSAVKEAAGSAAQPYVDEYNSWKTLVGK